MRFTYSIKQKMRIAMYLFGIMGAMILIRILEDRSIKNMNSSFVSMYNDRLIPAGDLFFLAENIYGKRFLLEDILSKTDIKNADFKLLENRLGSHNKKIDSLVGKYQQTSLVKQEKSHLEDLKTKLLEVRNVERDILVIAGSRSIEESKKMFETIGKTTFSMTIERLAELTRIQTKVGEELMSDSKFMVSGSRLYSAIQVGLAILIGILIVAIVFTSNSVKIQSNKFNLN